MTKREWIIIAFIFGFIIFSSTVPLWIRGRWVTVFDYTYHVLTQAFTAAGWGPK